MTCEACETARADRSSGLYHADCEGCESRALARSPMYFAAAKANAITPAYRDALQRVFGERWREGHAAVKAWT